MTVNRIVRIVAGTFIVLSLGLAHASGQIDLLRSPWLWFTAFVVQSGFTRFCPMDSILRRLGVPETERRGQA